MIELAPSSICTGCFACVNACAHQAIAMIADKEGFLQPVINTERCVECGICSKKCLVLNSIRKELSKQEAYAVISHHDRTLSSSGGASVNFNKMFTIVQNPLSDLNSCVNTILSKLDLKDRILINDGKHQFNLELNIDYKRINEELEVWREDSWNFFVDSLQAKEI